MRKGHRGRPTRTKRELIESHALLRAVENSTIDRVWAVDAADFGLLSFNEAYRAHFLNDWGVAVALGDRPGDLYPRGDTSHAWTRMYRRALAEGSYTTDYASQSGGRILLLSLSVLRAEGEVFAISVFGRDVTDQRRAEEALRDSESRFRSLFECMAEGVALHRLVLDPEGRAVDYEIVEANDAYARQTGLDVETVRGARASRLYGTGTPPYLETYAAVALGGTPTAFESYFAPLGRHFQISAFSPKPGWFATVFSDITERRFREEVRDLTTRFVVDADTPGDFRATIRAMTSGLKEWSGCDAVGIRLRDGDDFPYFETHGFPAAFVEHESRLCSRDGEGAVLRDEKGAPVLECMCGNVLCGRTDPTQPFFTPFGSFWSNGTTQLLASTTDADRQARTRNRCNGEGYESVALVPLRHGDRVFGLLQFNDHRPCQFPPGWIRRVEEMADVLAIVLLRREAEEALRQSEAGLAESQRIARLGSFSWDLDAGRITWSDEMYRLHDLTRDRFDGRPNTVLALIHPDDRQAFARAAGGTGGPGAMDPVDFRVVHRDGSVHTLHAQGVHRYDDLRPSRQCVGTVQDVTELREAESLVRASEQKWRSLVSTLPDYVSLLDRDGRYLFLNHFAEGFHEGDIMGKSILDVLPPGSAEVLSRKLSQCQATRATQRFELVGFGPRRTLREYEWYVVPLSSTDAPGGFMVVLRDIDDRSQAERDRRALEGQLLQAQKMESVGRLAGGVAHDFNNALGVILGHTELALQHVPPHLPLHADLAAVHAAAERSAALTRQLLAFARKQVAAPRVLDLNGAVQDLLAMLTRLIGEDVHLAWKPSPGLWRIKIDQTQLGQVLTNLCVNARDAIDGVGRVTIETANCSLDAGFCAAHPGSLPGDFVDLSVSDDGCGIDEDTQAHLFEPFFTTKEVGKGTGLGLSTVFGIVKQNGGFLGVTSARGEGATFSVYLPRQEGAAEPAARAAARPAALHGQGTILVVEDEPANLSLVSRMLEGHGYVVLGARTPREALRLAEAHLGEIDLLVTDVIMPEMNGLALAGIVRERTPRVRCLFMSGYTDDVLARQGVLDDGVIFIQKPFATRDLIAKVGDALGKGT